jgi:hypothetical protein
MNNFDQEAKKFEKEYLCKNKMSKSMNFDENSSNSTDEIFVKDGKLKCSYCDKTFIKKEYLEKHMKKYCKMLIQFNNIYDFKNMKLAKDIYNNKEAGDIYIIKTDYLNYDYFKIGISSRLDARIKDYRCGNTYEPRLYYYIPCKDIRGIDSELNKGLLKFNVKREIFKGDVEKIKDEIVSIVKKKYPKDDIKAYEPEIKIGEFTECQHCKKCFFNSSSLHEHFSICEEYRESFNKFYSDKSICKYCKKEFTTRQGKYKHMKLHCKEKNDEKDIIIAELKNNVEELKKTVEQLILNQGKNMVQPKLNNGTINNVGNVKNMKNKTNIQINNYGCENIDYITDKVFKKLLNTPMSAIQKLIEYKHFHPDHPENHNVKITNIHDKYAKIYKDKKWLVKHKKDIVEDLVENGYADFEEFKNLNEDQLAEKVKEKFEMMQKKFNNNFEGICKSSELSIINGSNP